MLICPIWPLSEFEEKSAFFKSRKGKEVLRQGNALGYHLLNKCELNGFETEYLVVDFRSVYSVPFDFLVEFAQKNGKMLRLPIASILFWIFSIISENNHSCSPFISRTV